MTSSFLEEAEQEGFAQGWFDGLQNQPAIPKPAISPGMFDLEYLKRFKISYLDGHATALREQERREILLQKKTQDQSRDSLQADWER